MKRALIVMSAVASLSGATLSSAVADPPQPSKPPTFVQEPTSFEVVGPLHLHAKRQEITMKVRFTCPKGNKVQFSGSISQTDNTRHTYAGAYSGYDRARGVYHTNELVTCTGKKKQKATERFFHDGLSAQLSDDFVKGDVLVAGFSFGFINPAIQTAPYSSNIYAPGSYFFFPAKLR